VHEYNTHYFPKLCLDEEPSVDMSGHEVEYHGEDGLGKDSALTSNALYALEQAKYKKELASFAWSRWDAKGDANPNESASKSSDVGSSPPADISVSSPEASQGSIAEPLVSETATLAKPPEAESSAAHPAVEAPGPLPPLPDSPRSAVTAEDVLQSTPHGLLTSPGSAPPVSRPIAITAPARAPVQLSSPRPITAAFNPDGPLMKRDVVHDINLPTGLPSSGLSVSDLVSIPSTDVDSPSRIVRRHKTLPSIDMTPMSRLSVELGGRIENLGDDDWEQLDSAEGIDSLPNGAPHLTTGGSFINRVLRRRPSAVHLSGLRRTIKSSDSSLSSISPSKSGSPTKKSPMPLFSRNGTKKALDKLDKLKVFPKTWKVPPSSYQPPAGVGRSSSPDGPPRVERPPNPRRHTESGWFDQRHMKVDEMSSASASVSASSTTRSVSAKMAAGQEQTRANDRSGMSRSVGAMPGRKADLKATLPETPERPPRVSLTKTPPIVWEME